MTDAVVLQQASNQTLQNASNSLQGGFNSAWSLVVPLGVILGVVAAVFIGSEVKRIEWVHQKLQAFSQSLYYTVVGVASTGVVGVLIAPLYYLGQADGQTQTYAAYAVGGLVAAYVVFTGLGYVIDSVILSNVREYRETRNAEVTADD